MCYIGPKHFKDPFTIIAIFVDNASASSIEWVVRITVESFLLAETSDITFHIFLLASGSIPVEGSSKNMIGGFPNKARATDNLRLFPPE